MPAPTKLRDLIKQIRACKTAADERDFVTKECASIRTLFRDEDNDFRCRNVAKVLYIHMLGYPAHFGQLECMKLIASPKFTDKRIGYLGAMMLLDERQDVHLLITNCLKNDLNHESVYVVGLALCTLGSICSLEMCRDLVSEVEKLLKTGNAYIKKKAALCATRMISKVPELMDSFVPVTRQLLTEKNHGVVLSGVVLITEMCKVSPDTVPHFKKQVGNLVKILKTLSMSGYSPDHDVSGISDPFLQVKVLRLLRVLGHGDNETSDAMNDILAQVATNTETSKNVGNSILYEVVLTIMDINSESGLRVLAVNILGRFLLNTDKNIRYVALNTLLKTAHADHTAVQRHRNTVVDCLKDPDISIRRRAIELCFALINDSNVKSLTKEIVSFLSDADMEFKAYIASNLILAAEKHAPDQKWHVDTVLQVLTMAGAYVEEDLVPVLIQLFAGMTELHTYIVQQLYVALSGDISQQSLVQIGVWCIGEYGDLLLLGPTQGEEAIEVSESDALNVLQAVLESPHSLPTSLNFAVTSVMKLSTRFTQTVERIQGLVAQYGTNLDVELQQRSVEYSQLFSAFNHMRSALLERMPLPDVKASASVNDTNGAGESLPTEANAATLPGLQAAPLPVKPAAQEASLLDLLGDSEAVAEQPVSNQAGNELLDILGGLSVSAPAAVQPVQSNAPSSGSGLMDLLGGGTPPSTDTGSIPSMTVFNKNGLTVEFLFSKIANNPSNIVDISMFARNSQPVAMTDFLFQVAVPKAFQLNIQSPSGNVIPPSNSGSVTQIIQVANPQRQQLRMRLRISYSLNGSPVTEQGEIGDFPPAVSQ
ncbi:AP-1 complex subunit gamma-1-like [Corticium candelabrum]|uniref:AP-1 complex subunit gamma-1-like n=1 Tax=Corticium candelabrum TaxID=121492 RepID=UPI002E259C53|nr:AP-1 complex subunit gamma-1-like [Corticium candelabrum]